MKTYNLGNALNTLLSTESFVFLQCFFIPISLLNSVYCVADNHHGVIYERIIYLIQGVSEKVFPFDKE